jgi:hypothetical protein
MTPVNFPVTDKATYSRAPNDGVALSATPT